MEKNRAISTAMPCQCKAYLDQLASPEWLWLYEKQHHAAKSIIFVCPHCDTALPPKNKNTPSDKAILKARLLKCPSCSRQEHPFLFVRRPTAFACGFCFRFYVSSAYSSSPSSAPGYSSAAKTASSSPSASSSDSHRQARRRYFAHLAAELHRNDKRIKQGKPPREWSHTSVIAGLLQRPGIVKHWEALIFDRNKDDGGSSRGDGGNESGMTCKIPPGLVPLFSWHNTVEHTDGMDNLQNLLQFFDLEKDGDEKAAKLAELAFEQADKIFQPTTGGVVAKHQVEDTNCVGGNKDQEDWKKKSKFGLDKPLPALPASAFKLATTSSSSIAQQALGLKSTDRRMKRDKRRDDDDSKTRRKVRTIVKQIEMALAAAYR